MPKITPGWVDKIFHPQEPSQPTPAKDWFTPDEVEFINEVISQAQEEARKEGEKKWLAWAKGLLKEDVSGPNDCSGADYHLPACGGTCGEMLAEVDERWNLRNFEITEAVEKLEQALSTSEEEL